MNSLMTYIHTKKWNAQEAKAHQQFLPFGQRHSALITWWHCVEDRNVVWVFWKAFPCLFLVVMWYNDVTLVSYSTSCNINTYRTVRMRISPDSAVRRPARVSSKVVLPDPFGPRIDQDSPADMIAVNDRQSSRSSIATVRSDSFKSCGLLVSGISFRCLDFIKDRFVLYSRVLLFCWWIELFRQQNTILDAWN